MQAEGHCLDIRGRDRRSQGSLPEGSNIYTETQVLRKRGKDATQRGAEHGNCLGGSQGAMPKKAQRELDIGSPSQGSRAIMSPLFASPSALAASKAAPPTARSQIMRFPQAQHCALALSEPRFSLCTPFPWPQRVASHPPSCSPRLQDELRLNKVP